MSLRASSLTRRNLFQLFYPAEILLLLAPLILIVDVCIDKISIIISLTAILSSWIGTQFLPGECSDIESLRHLPFTNRICMHHSGIATLGTSFRNLLATD